MNASQPVSPASIRRLIFLRVNSCIWLCTPHTRPDGAIRRKASYRSSSSTRGKRPGVASKVENLNAHTPPSIKPAAACMPCLSLSVPNNATSTWQSRSTSAILASSCGRDATGSGSSYGISTMTVTPLAAGVDLTIHHARHDPAPAGVNRVACRWRLALAARGYLAIAHADPTVFHYALSLDNIAVRHQIEIAHYLLRMGC